MVSKEDLKKDEMWFEAVDRLELMNAHYQDRWLILMNRSLEFKIVVNTETQTIRRVDTSDDELRMIKEIEKEYEVIIYYLIEDEGVWPDGCTFRRYTLPYVGRNEAEYESEREESIMQCGTCPAVVINLEEPDCSEITEFKYHSVQGMIVNLS